MGMAAAFKASRILANAQRVVAAELLCAAQGLEFLAPLRPGRGVERPVPDGCETPETGCPVSKPTAHRRRTWSDWPPSSARGRPRPRPPVWLASPQGHSYLLSDRFPSFVPFPLAEPDELREAEGNGPEIRAEGRVAAGHRCLPAGHPGVRGRGRSRPGPRDLQPCRRPLPQGQRTGAAVQAYERAVDLYKEQGSSTTPSRSAARSCGSIRAGFRPTSPWPTSTPARTSSSKPRKTCSSTSNG